MPEQFTPETTKELKIEQTDIPGLLVIHLPVHSDTRGWFKENWQRQKMIALGLSDFQPVQNNVAFNEKRGTTRGLHAEPWDKYVSVSTGKVDGVWVDLRQGNESKKFALEIDPSTAVFVPRGVANGYQTLEDNSTYIYLVNAHWQAGLQYIALNLKEVEDILPIPLEKAEISEKDKQNPTLAGVEKMPALKTFITGGYGQLGQALKEYFPDAEYVDLDTFDISNENSYKSKNWSDYSTIINAAAYTAVDQAETTEGRETAWSVNARALKYIAQVAIGNNLTLVHISSDYVFDGTQSPHKENEPFSPLGVYGQSKAAGDIATGLVPKHYIFRPSWMVGKGKNFIKTMAELADRGVEPSVINDQTGRLTFAKDLANAIHYILQKQPDYGTYNMTNDGDVVSWADIAKLVFEQTSHDPDKITGVTTQEYYTGKDGIAPRPLKSELDLGKIKSIGFRPRDWRIAFNEYIQELKERE